MGLEIERKFLIKQEEWAKACPYKSNLIRQAYLLTDPQKTIRLRVTDNKGFITIKGARKDITRHEFEYEIPVEEANQMIDHYTAKVIEKIRHYVSFDNKTWEVDEFKGINEGLWVAEIELQSADEKILLPDWIDKEVSSDNRYANSSLISNPYSNW